MRPITVSFSVGDSESTKSVDLSGQACPLGKPVSREIQVADKSLSGSTFLNQCFLLSPTHTSLWHPTTPQNKVWTLPCDRVSGKWSEPHLPVNGLQRTFYSPPSHFSMLSIKNRKSKRWTDWLPKQNLRLAEFSQWCYVMLCYYLFSPGRPQLHEGREHIMVQQKYWKWRLG